MLTQAQLAKKIRINRKPITPVQVNYILNAKRNASRKTAEKLVNILGGTVDLWMCCEDGKQEQVKRERHKTWETGRVNY